MFARVQRGARRPRRAGEQRVRSSRGLRERGAVLLDADLVLGRHDADRRAVGVRDHVARRAAHDPAGARNDRQHQLAGIARVLRARDLRHQQVGARPHLARLRPRAEGARDRGRVAVAVVRAHRADPRVRSRRMGSRPRRRRDAAVPRPGRRRARRRTPRSRSDRGRSTPPGNWPRSTASPMSTARCRTARPTPPRTTPSTDTLAPRRDSPWAARCSNRPSAC